MDYNRLIKCGLAAVAFLFVMLFVIAPAMDDAMHNITNTLYEQLKLCEDCGSIEALDATECSKCGSTNFADNWCNKCNATFETKPAYCPNCGKKQ